MNKDLRWNLDNIYSAIDSDKYKGDFSKLVSMTDEFNKWAKEIDSKESIKVMEEYIAKTSEIYTLIEKINLYVNLLIYGDTSNTEALKARDLLSNVMTELTLPNVLFQKWLSKLGNLSDLIEKSDSLIEHKFMLMEIYESSKHLLDEKEEILISKLRQTGSESWEMLQSILTSTLTVNLGNEEESDIVPISVARNLAYHENQATRKNAYEKELKSYEKIEDSIAYSINSIKGEVNTIAELRGYESPLHEALKKSKMQKETLDAMLSAIKDYLPDFWRYFKRKGELMGSDKGLAFYDLFAPIGKTGNTFTYDEARGFIEENFAKYSEKLKNYAKKAFDEEWIDVAPRENKVSGAFCSGCYDIEESRILTNFTGTMSDVITLAHELGHGYHNDCIYGESILNTDSPMPLAETASTFCETIVNQAIISSCETDEEKLYILDNSLQDAGQVICDIYSRFLFESEVFENRKDSSLSVADLKEAMTNSQKEAYGSGLNHELLHPYMWVIKPHYYSGSLSFYNFPYAFGLLFAKGLYSKYLEDKEEFIPKYDILLSSTGKNTAEDVAKIMDVDITKKEFWASSLELIKGDIEKFLEITSV
jgi:pepF/M3 family oligoendopeptidase